MSAIGNAVGEMVRAPLLLFNKLWVIARCDRPSSGPVAHGTAGAGNHTSRRLAGEPVRAARVGTVGPLSACRGRRRVFDL